MTPNKQLLNALIEAMPVCADVKVGIRALVAEITSLDLTLEPPTPTYKAGDRFILRMPGFESALAALQQTRVYLLVSLGGHDMALINTENGLRIGPNFIVKCRDRVTEQELKLAALFGGESDDYFRRAFMKV